MKDYWSSMKFYPFHFAMIVVFLLGFNSCKKDDSVPPVQPEDMWQCHIDEDWPQQAVEDQLIGEWSWEYISCYWAPDDANDDEHVGLTLSFHADNTVQVFENGSLVSTSDWEVTDGDSETYKLELNPAIVQCQGRILFCEEWVEFNDSYIDGCDNYFIKID